MTRPSRTTITEHHAANTGGLDPWLSRAQVAEALGISVRSLDRMIEAEEFPRPVRFGRQLRWRRSVVEAHLQKLEAAAQAN